MDKKSRKHILQVPKNNTMPEHMIFVDTETTQTDANGEKIYQDIMLGVGIYWHYRKGRKNKKVDIFRFKEPMLFWEFVMSHTFDNQQVCVFAHNAVFDMTVLQHIHWLEHFGYECKFVFDNAMTFIAKWVRDGSSILILNTANWFKGSVARWGDELGLEKLVMPDKDATEEEWFVYCERDTMILKDLMEWYIAFLTTNDLGPWRYTIASQAFTAFRHRFMRNKICVPDNDTETQLARSSYKGGRTEVFKQGVFNDGPYYKIDVNSMYPYVMSENKYPIGLAHVGTDLRYEQAEYMRGKFGIIAECTICTPIPFFVEASTGRNIYPVGTFRTVLTTNEFYRAFDNRWIHAIHSFVTYRMRRIFRPYVDFFYGLKVQCTIEGKRLQRAFTKLYLNSLYGKFGQRGYKDEEIGQVLEPGLGIWYAIDAETHEHYVYRLIGHSLIRSWQEGESYNSFCAIASHVTANARLYLYDAVLKAGRDNVFYTDTDSMIVNQQGYDRIRDEMDDTRLGAWALEGISDTVAIMAPKHYWFDGKWKRKGVRKDAVELERNVFKQEIWPGFNSILKTGKERYYNKFVIKTLSPEIRTGRVMQNGDVLPIEMDRLGEGVQWYK